MSARRDVAENTTAVGGVFQQWNVIRLVELNFIVSYIYVYVPRITRMRT